MQRVPALAGRTGSLLAYQSPAGRFAVECAGKANALLLKPENLRDAASGALLTPPVEVADGPHGQKLLRPRRRFAAGRGPWAAGSAACWPPFCLAEVSRDLPRVVRATKSPTPKEKELHEAINLPHAEWCEFCVAKPI